MTFRRWALGVATFWPLLYIVLFFVSVAALVSDGSSGLDDVNYMASPAVLFALHGGTMVLILVLLGVYLVHAYRNSAMPGDRRVFWAIAILTASVFAMPIYWWLYVRPRGERARSEGCASA